MSRVVAGESEDGDHADGLATEWEQEGITVATITPTATARL